MADSFSILERTDKRMTALICAFDADGATYTSGNVDVENACGVIHEVIYVPTTGDEIDTGGDIEIQDENGFDILRGKGTNVGTVIKDIFIDEDATHLKYAMCAETLKFVGTAMGVGGGSGTLIILLN